MNRISRFLMIPLMTAVVLTGTLNAAQTGDMVADALKQVKSSLGRIPEGIQKVAVYAIESDARDNLDTVGIQDQLTTILLESEKFAVIDRKALKALLEEQALSMTGLVDEGQIVKTGKLIGVQGFFFGSVQMEKDKVILNLRLIDVQSSAIVYSKKFTGESSDFSRFGIGWGYATSPLYKANLDFATPNNGDVLTEHVLLDGINSSSIANFSLSYKQGFQSMKLLLLCVDLNFQFFPEGKTGTYKSGNVPYSNANSFGTYNLKEGITLFTLNIKPKILLSSKKLLGLENDIFNLYAGGSISALMVNSSQGAWMADDKNSTSIEYTKATSMSVLFTVLPVFGVDINFTKALTVFVEGTYYFDQSFNQDSSEYIANMVTRCLPGMKQSLSINAGVKYYIF